MILRIRYRQLGGHVHMRVFAGKHEGALGKCGDLCMRAEEFECLVNDWTTKDVQFMEEEEWAPTTT